ncbi:recombinase family protein [Arthrobacter ulcerisalmonis]|uniref:recombinase family protein n=1 Tax=Arthrobacter ulcerisalmonis TaxID=2483813 RepID=UPI0039ED302B
MGYARCSTNTPDLTAHHHALGVEAEVVHVNHGFTGTKRGRPGRNKTLAACYSGDTFVVTKVDRLARSLPEARDIADELTRKSVSLNIGGSIYNPHDPVGKLLFNVLGMVAEFEEDLIRARTRAGW